MKPYTSLEQSQKLAEILPIESADLYWQDIGGIVIPTFELIGSDMPKDSIVPCWSLAALLDILPADYIAHKHYFLEISKMGDNTRPYKICYFRKACGGTTFGRIIHISYTADNLVEACYEMILELHKRKLL